MNHIISVEQAKTLDGLFNERVKCTPEAEAYRYYDAERATWCVYTWSQMNAQVALWQAALIRESLPPGDRVAVMIRNSPEWVMFDQAALGLGLVVVPFYTEDRADNIAYMLADAGVRLLILEDSVHTPEICEACSNIESLQRIVLVESTGEKNTSSSLSNDPRLMTLSKWLPAKAEEIQHISSDPNSLATIIYTSGTTGRPKGVMLNHHNILTNAYSSLQVVQVTPNDLLLSFLPLSHTFERTVGYYLPMMCGATIAYARSIPQLQEDLLTIRPTILISVPRIYERIYAGIRTKLAEGSSFARWLFEFTAEVGYSRFEHQQKRASWRPVFLLWPLLDHLVASKLMNKLGGRLRHAMSGGAALSAEISRVFIGLGLPILQGYGMTESSPVVCVNRHEDNVPASVGLPLPGVEVKLGEDDALLIRGPNIMMGYWNNPQATQAIISTDGWLNSGDVASIDSQGHITITGRLKDIIVLSTGEKIPPGDMETAILRDQIFEQIMVIGEARSFLSVLVVLDKNNWNKFAAEQGIDADIINANDAQKQKIEEILLEKVTYQTREFPGYARIRKITIMPEPWTVDNEMLTPTLKLRRSKIMEQFKAKIERMYEGH
ncbi:AMP-dependent synthetase/ligase [Nitrosomonas aestuarii]|uniref:AMP-dependent synthetase/ligase n=1 Tax=Nitrosomonas aestuarii TaxID=52441 RepID=UPI000D2F8FC7|nr:AMP-dependent synthetase/ligase [Nitrosomonas aestuarii]PTN12697.1 long-chain acyl-CoA synthetase [Nitrosomonas aestuarii]